MLGVHSARMFGPESARGRATPATCSSTSTPAPCPGVEELTIFSSFQTVSTYLGDQRITSNLKRTDGAFWRVFDFTFLEGGPYGRADVDDARFVAVISRATRRAPVRRRSGARQDLRGRRAVVPGRRRRRERAGHPLRAVRRRLRADHDGRRPTPTSASSWRASRRWRWRAPPTTCRSSARSSTPGCRASSCPTRPTSRWSPPSRPSTTPSPANRRSPTAPARIGQGSKLTVFLVILALLFVTLPTVNLVNVNISRILERASEIGVRKAFGAPTRTLIAQFVVENVILTLLGGAIGLVLSGLVLRAHEPERLHRALGVHHQRPRLRLRRADRVRLRRPFGRLSGLADGAAPPRRGPQGRTVAMTRHLVRLIWNRKRQNLLLTIEILCAFLVVFVVALFGLTFAVNARAPLGFDTERVWTIDVGRPRTLAGKDGDGGRRRGGGARARGLHAAAGGGPRAAAGRDRGRRVHRAVHQRGLGQRADAGRRPQVRLPLQPRDRRLHAAAVDAHRRRPRVLAGGRRDRPPSRC